MKKNLSISAFSCLLVFAAGIPLDNCFSQEIIQGFSTFNNIQLNPAYAGEDGKHAFNLAEELDTKYFDPEIKGTGWPEFYEFAYAANIPKLHSGAGLFASLYKIGIENYYKIGGLYNYNFKLSENSNLRVGVQLNLLLQKVKFSEINDYFIFPDTLWLTPPEDTVYSKFNFSPGTWYRLKGFNAGFCADNVLNDKRHNRMYSLITYYNFKAGEKVKITPSLTGRLINYRENTVKDLHFQLHAEFFNRIIIAGGYGSRQPERAKSSSYITANLGVKIAKSVLVMFGYSALPNYTFRSENVSALLKVNFK